MRDVIKRRLSWRKWFAYCASRFFSAPWQFRVFGLPAISQTLPHPVGCDDVSSLFEVKPGTACYQGAHLDAEQRIIASLSQGSTGPIKERFILRQQFFPRVTKIHGTIASMVLDGDVNYFHWLLETLPRWRFLQPKQADVDRIFVCQKHSFHQEAVRLLGISPESILNSSKIRYLQADRLLVPRNVRRQEPWVVPWLRHHFLAQANSSSVTRPHTPKIYISRRPGTSRAVNNEAELIRLLAEFGFNSVLLEHLPWLEQIALFQRAEAVVAPHGAGLTNLIFCEPSTLVVELKHDVVDYRFFEEIGAERSLKYQKFLCSKVGSGAPQTLPIQVDVKALRKLLKSLF